MKSKTTQHNAEGAGKKVKQKLSLKQKSFLISGGAHLALVVSLLVSFEFSAKPVDLATGKKDTQAPIIIEATFIDSNVIQQQKREKAQAEAAAKAKAAREREQRRKEQQRKENAEKAKRRKAAEDKKRKEDARKEQVRKEKERKQRELKEQAALAAEQAKRDKAEKELQDKLRKEQQAREKVMQQQMAAEQAERNERRQREILSGIEIANSKIRARIEQNLIETGNLTGKSCRLQLKIAANGLVLDAVRVDGDESLCLALRSAALRARTLPMPSDDDINAQIRNSILRWDN